VHSGGPQGSYLGRGVSRTNGGSPRKGSEAGGGGGVRQKDIDGYTPVGMV